MTIAQQDHKLRRRQVAYQEGIHLLRMTRGELGKNIASADSWALVAVMSNAVLVPLNIILNTFLPFSPTSKVQKVVKFVYDKTAASGTRGQTDAYKEAIGTIGDLGKETIDYLGKNALPEYVPGVRILVGMAQDSLALIDVANETGKGQQEMRGQLLMIDRKIEEFLRIMERIGIERALLHDKMATQRRTA